MNDFDAFLILLQLGAIAAAIGTAIWWKTTNGGESELQAARDLGTKAEPVWVRVPCSAVPPIKVLPRELDRLRLATIGLDERGLRLVSASGPGDLLMNFRAEKTELVDGKLQFETRWPAKHTTWLRELAAALDGATDRWFGELARAAKLPLLDARTAGTEDLRVELRKSGALALRADLPVAITAQPGKGSTGNPVVDMLLEVQTPGALPEAATEPLLALVHGRGATLMKGKLSLQVQVDFEQALEAVRELVALEASLRQAGSRAP